MELHEKFLDSCLNECLLASQELLKILTKLMTTCLMFADHMNKFMADEETENREILFALRNSSVVAGSSVETLTGAANRERALKRAESNNSMKGDKVPAVKTTSAQTTAQLKKLRDIAQTEYIQKETSHDSFQRILHKFSKTFDEQVFIYI